MTKVRYLQIAAALLAFAVAVAVWLALSHPDEPLYLLLVASNLALALVVYVSWKGAGAADGSENDGPENFVQIVIDSIPDPVLVIGKDHSVTAMNKRARAACDDDGQAPGRFECYRVMEQLGVPCEQTGRPCSLKSGKACRHLQSRRNEHGDILPVEIFMTPLVDEAGEFAGAIEVVHDLNESEQIALKLRQEKEDAETVSRAKSECVAMMSHEVRTPMNAVLGMADLLQVTKLTRKQQDYVRTIQSSGSALLSLVDNVIDYSELQAGELVIRNRSFDVRLFIENILEIMGFQAYSKGLELGCRIETDVPGRLMGDEDRLRQVLVNLVGNAVRYSNRGEVVISVQTMVNDSGEAIWRCAITDSGVGIEEAVRETLFAPFAHAGQRDSIGTHGSGLGLTVCKWLVEGMRGKISIESEPGKGTCVSFELPLEISDLAVAAETPPAILDGLRAIVIHGNEPMCTVIRDYLSDYGMRCDTSCEGKSALQRLQDATSQEQAYDVAIIDAGLPAMDGLTLVRRIRSERQIADLPVILLTPIAYPLEVGQISRIGGIRCVNKPVLPGELKHNLCKLVANDQSSVVVDSGNDYGADTSAETGELRILIAEDNALSRQLLKNMLISVGCEADTANDGPSVLEALADDAYDLVLMDCQMPGMDGDEVTRHVRSEPGKYRAQPVIVAVTADVSPNHRAACREAGMDDFLAKPVRRRQLVEGLQRWSADVSRTQRETSDASESLTPEQQIRAQLLNRGEDDKDFLRVYIDAFLDDTSSRLKLIDAAAEREDWHSARRECHALRGACLEMGAAAMEKHCVTVGNAAENGNASRARDAVRDLEKEFDHIRPVFTAAKKHFSA